MTDKLDKLRDNLFLGHEREFDFAEIDNEHLVYIKSESFEVESIEFVGFFVV